MSTDKNVKVVILGLSDDPNRYAYKAAQRLKESSFPNVMGIHPSGKSVLGIPVLQSLAELTEPVHTLTIYLNPARIDPLFEAILKARPKRIIFNPGTEHPTLMRIAKQKGIQVVEACTLVLLASKQF